MGRYEVNKVMRSIALDERLRDAFRSDPDVVLDGRELTDDERRALAERDFGALYGMGAHPFLLWTWAGTVSERGLDLLRSYTEAVAQHPVQDIST